MLENAMYAMLTQTLVAMAPLRGVSNAQFLLRHQPTQQGRPTGRTVWMNKILDKPRGTPMVTQVATDDGIPRKEVQAMERTIQFSVTMPTSTEPTALTHGDVLTRILRCVQSRDFQEKLRPFAASVLRVSEIRNSYIANDRDNWEANPSFDLIVKHEDVFIDSVPQIDTFEFEVIRVPDLAA